MCRYLDFLEWAGQVSGGIPSTIQRNPKLDARLAKVIEARRAGAVDPVHESAGRRLCPTPSAILP
jgi:hypothetical protein